jgi:hypothetical protein
MLGGIVEVDLVCSNAEASDDDQVLCLTQHSVVQLRLGANTNNVDVTI